MEGEPAAKRGKLDGPRQVYRTSDGEHLSLPASQQAPEGGTSLLEPLIRDGKIVRDFDVDAAAERAHADAEAVGLAEAMFDGEA